MPAVQRRARPEYCERRLGDAAIAEHERRARRGVHWTVENDERIGAERSGIPIDHRGEARRADLFLAVEQHLERESRSFALRG